jgi:putative Holliday junction resolvase
MAETEKTPFSDCILALDIGKKRIGMAVNGLVGDTVIGLETLQRTRIREDLEQLKRIADERSVTMLLVGLPLHMSGGESRQSEYTRAFADRLAEVLRIPVVYWDERLTSAAAERMLKTHGATLQQQKSAVDRLSAVMLLESYLGARASRSATEAGRRDDTQL